MAPPARETPTGAFFRPVSLPGDTPVLAVGIGLFWHWFSYVLVGVEGVRHASSMDRSYGEVWFYSTWPQDYIQEGVRKIWQANGWHVGRLLQARRGEVWSYMGDVLALLCLGVLISRLVRKWKMT